jgi:hypothetical protein
LTRIITVLLCVCVLGASSVAFAKGNKESWANLNALQSGDKIEVVETSSARVSGTLVNFSATAISLDAASGHQTIQKQDVRSIKLMKSTHRLRNTFLFAGVGAGAGAGIGAAAYKSCAGPSCIGSFNRGESAGIGAVLGFVGGAVVGVLWPSHETIYQAASP